MFGYLYKQAEKSGNIGCAITIIAFVLFIATLVWGKYLIQTLNISIGWRTIIRVVLFLAAFHGFTMAYAATEDQYMIMRILTKH